MSDHERREASDMSGFGRVSEVDDREGEQDATSRINPIARVGWWCLSKLTAPVTATKYSPGQRVEIEGKHYLVRRVLTPEPFYEIREPKVVIRRVGDGDGIQQRRMAERVLDLYRAGRIASSEEADQ
jgi:hypothetical protein